MIANHIHDALDQVKALQEMILEKRLFRGYSGTARIASGSLALAAALVLQTNLVPPNPWHHLAGWGVVLFVALILNYGALSWWFLFDHKVRGNISMIKPAIDAIPPLAVGAGLSLAAIIRADFDLLFGIWMCCYGLVHCAHRHSLPKGIYFTGLFYLACGAYCLIAPGISFTSPLPMGVAFFLGELSGGLILLRVSGKEEKEDSPRGPARPRSHSEGAGGFGAPTE